MGLIRRAMAFRVKYRVANADGSQKRCMALSLLGVHAQNRGGVYPSPETVHNLGLSLLTKRASTRTRPTTKAFESRKCLPVSGAQTL